MPVIYVLSGLNVIKEWNRRPVLLFGKYAKTAGPGLCWIEPVVHSVLSDISIQDIVEDLRAENVQTHDNVRLNISGVLTTRISPDNIKRVVVEVSEVRNATKARAFAAVTEVVGKYVLDHILERRDEFSVEIKRALQEKVSGWGVEVKAVEIVDFKIADTAIEQSIAMKARAEKEAQGELKRAEMQKQIAEKLNEAADALDEEGWRLKNLEVMLELCRSAQNNTIMFPSDILGALSHFSRAGMNGTSRTTAVSVAEVAAH